VYVVMKILIVDDEQSIREVLKYILVDGQYEILETDRGETAIELVLNNDIHLMFLDYRLPGISGVEVLKQLRLLKQHLKIIIISGFDLEEIEDEISGLNNIVDILHKPFSTEYIVNKVKEVSKNVIY